MFYVQKHPGTIVYNVNRFEGWSSLESMWHQVMEIGNDVANISASHPEGINLIGKIMVLFIFNIDNLYVTKDNKNKQKYCQYEYCNFYRTDF